MKNTVLFYYPQHFNRSKEGTNPFFDPLIEACEKNGILYEVYEEPDRGTDKPRNPKAKKADTFYWTVTIIRKILSKIVPNKDFFQRERYAAKILNLITFNKYKYHRYVTISGSMYHLFSFLNRNGKVFDMQHGILFKKQPTFFDETSNQLRRQFFRDNLHFFFWGKGYMNVFSKDEEKILQGRCHITGYPSLLTEFDCKKRNKRIKRNKIIVSLQFTHSIDMEERLQMKSLLEEFLAKIEREDISILLKHHPRYNNSIDIKDIFEKYPNVEFTNKLLKDLASECFLHITFYSTTAFEFAEFGIPTYFLYNDKQPYGNSLFKEEYNYPLYWDMSINEVINRLQEEQLPNEDSEKVKGWYNKFYSPFDENAFLDALDFSRT